ncbi:MAG: PQQ-binding-like beta-propeller repeat protein [Deltaproteobacteria bacterium]|nr:PQQ-binding-like beta-propeller repeat protein [Deltaproteobacteria bacterium]
MKTTTIFASFCFLLAACSQSGSDLELDLTGRHLDAAKADGSRVVQRVSETVDFLADSETTPALRFHVGIEVANLAYHKRVGIVYSVNNDSHWSRAEARWTEGERWIVTLERPAAGFRSLKYAIWYQALGVTYWDNNRGDDFHVSTIEHDGVTSFVSPSAPVQGTDPVCVTVLYPRQSYAAMPSAFLRMTKDAWSHQQDVRPSSQQMGRDGSTSMVGWQFELGGLLPGSVVEMTPAVIEDGKTHWGTPYGENMVVEPECGGDCLAAAVTWKQEGGFGPTLVQDGTVYVAAGGTLRAMDAATGAQRWSAQVDNSPLRILKVGSVVLCNGAENLAGWDASTGTPLFVFTAGSPTPGRVLPGSKSQIYLQANSMLYALSPKGTELWRLSGARKAMVLPDEDVAILTEGSSPEGGVRTTLIRYAAETGAEMWNLRLPEPAAPYTMNSVLERPGPDGAIYVTRGSELSAVGASGQVRWQRDVEYRSSGQYGGELGFQSDGTIIFPGQRPTAVRASDGAVLWQTSGACCLFGGPTVGPNDTVYDIRGWKSRSLEAWSDGELLWSQSGAGLVQAFALRGADVVILSKRYYDPDHTIGVLLQTVDLTTGQIASSLKVADDGGPTPTLIGHAGSMVILQHIDGEIFGIEL